MPSQGLLGTRGAITCLSALHVAPTPLKSLKTVRDSEMTFSRDEDSTLSWNVKGQLLAPLES